MEPTPLLLDSKSAVDMGKNYRDTRHSRHILRRYHYVREGEKDGHHILHWVPCEVQLADIGTKAVGGKDLVDRLKYIVIENT